MMGFGAIRDIESFRIGGDSGRDQLLIIVSGRLILRQYCYGTDKELDLGSIEDPRSGSIIDGERAVIQQCDKKRANSTTIRIIATIHDA